MNRLSVVATTLLTWLAIQEDVAHAVVIYSQAGLTVTTVSGYSDYGAGDVVFTVSNPPAGCDGFWLRPTDAGFKTLYTLLLTAYATRAPVEVAGYNDSLWLGAPNQAYCRVYGLYPS
jgi:hypothetical protein